VDELWEKLSAGGSEVQCGWAERQVLACRGRSSASSDGTDGDKDPAKSQRVFKAMLQMTKIDVEGLKRAYRGSENRGNEIEGDSMSQVRVLVGTRKGAFILTADGKRERWEVSGPHFAGGRFITSRDRPRIRIGCMCRSRADGSGKLFNAPTMGAKHGFSRERLPGEAPTPGPPKAASNKFVYDVSAETGKPLTTHQFYDGTQHPWEFQAGVASGARRSPILTRFMRGWKTRPSSASTDGGENWKELPACAATGPGQSGSRVAGGMCLHTIILDPSSPTPETQRIWIAISAAGAFSHRRWRQDLEVDQPRAEVRIYPRSERRGRALRSPHRDEPVAPGSASSCRSIGT